MDKKPAKLGLNDAGLGAVAGDWHIGVVPVTSTDGRHDSPQAEEAAERAEYNEHEARRRGERAECAALGLLRPRPAKPDLRNDPIMLAIKDGIRRGEGQG